MLKFEVGDRKVKLQNRGKGPLVWQNDTEDTIVIINAWSGSDGWYH